MPTGRRASAPSPPRRRRILIWAAAIVLGLSLILLMALPTLIRLAAQGWLRDHGHASAEIRNVDFNPFTGRVAVEFVETGEVTSDQIKIRKGSLQVSWWQLLRRRIAVGSVHLEDAVVDVRLDADGGFHVGRISFDVPPPPQIEEETTAWGIGTGAVEIRNVRVRYSDPVFRAEMLVREGHIEPLASWEPERATPFSLDLELNGGRIRLRGTFKPFLDDPWVSAQVKIEELPLGWVAEGLDLTGGMPFEMALDADATIEAAHLTASEAATLEFQGAIGLRGRLGPLASELDLADLRLEGLLASASGLRAEAVRIADLKGGFTYAGEPGTTLLDWLSPADEEPARAEEAVPADEAEEAPGFGVQLGLLELDGENRLTLRDESLVVPVEIAIGPATVTVENVDSADPERRSRVAVEASLGDYASVALEGSIAPFADQITGEIQGEVKSVDLPPFSPYTERYLGYRVLTGTLGAEMDVRVLAGRLDSVLDLRASKLEIGTLDADQKDEFTEELGLPLASALSLLTDRNGDIELKVPVEGDLADPEIGIGDALRRAARKGAAKALKTGAMAYFAPVGAAVMVGRLFGRVTALRFEPVEFEPGSSDLPPAALEHLGKMSELLQDRPKVRPNLCGLAVAADHSVLAAPAPGAPPASASPPAASTGGAAGGAGTPPPLRSEPMLQLARSRAEAIKGWLASQGGLDPDRLFICSPEVDEAEGAHPRVEISI